MKRAYFLQMSRIALFAASAVSLLAGCQPLDFYTQSPQQPIPAAVEPPRELSMVSLPAYRIAPPDVLEIEVLKLVPLPPYRAEIYDVLQIEVAGTLLDQPIAEFYLVEGDGTVNLGPPYGSVRVQGMTIDEAAATIETHLKQILTQPDVSVRLARTAGVQQVSGQYLVAPDGTINLQQYGSVHMAGKTVAEAQLALEKQLANFFDSPEVSLEVLAYNSKVYYVITEGAGLGDNVVRVPVTGNETVLDAISNIGGLSQVSSTRVWIARPAPAGFGCEQILPVDYDAITRGAATATNYQVLPGDRLFIAEDQTIALTNLIGKIVGPFERIAGFAALTSSTVRSFQALGSSSARFQQF